MVVVRFSFLISDSFNSYLLLCEICYYYCRPQGVFTTGPGDSGFDVRVRVA
jgi:hypothetical protein